MQLITHNFFNTRLLVILLHCYCAIYINLLDIFHLLINLLCEITRGKSLSRYDCQYQRAMQESVLFIEILCYLNKGTLSWFYEDEQAWTPPGSAGAINDA